MRAMSSPIRPLEAGFPFLFGGTFIEGEHDILHVAKVSQAFPFLFGGTFIEGVLPNEVLDFPGSNFPSFSEGLSLRARP